MVRIMKQFRANQGRFGQNKVRLGQNKCGFANLQTRINTGGEGGIRTHVPVKANAFRVISNQLNFSEVSGTCGNLKEVKTLVISRFFSSKKPQTPLYTTIFYIHINYIDFAHFWELIGNSLGKTFITYY